MGKASLTIQIGGEYNNKAIQKAQQDLRNMQLEAAKASGGIAGNVVNMGDKMVAAGQTVTRFGNNVSKMGQDLTLATAPIAALGGLAIKSFMDVEKGTHALITATGATGEAAKDLERAYRNAAVNVVGSFEDMGSAAGELNTRLGFVGDELTAATEQIAKYSKVTGVDMTQAVQDVASLMNNAQIEAKDFSRVLDWLTVAGQASGISVSNLTNSVNDNAAALKEMGFSTEASIALLANLEKEGANTSAILTAMKKGVTTWSKDGKDAAAEFANFVQGVKDGSIDMAYAIEVFGSKAGVTMFDAAQKGQLDFMDMYDAIIKGSAGALNEVYENTLTAQERMEISTKKIQERMADTGAVIMDKLVPVIDNLLNTVDDLVSWFDNLDDSTQEAVVQFGLLAVAAGPVLLVGGKMVAVIGQMITGVGKGVQSLGIFINSLKTTSSVAGAASTSMTKASTSATKLGSGASAAVKGLSGLKMGLAGLGIAAAVALIGVLIDQFQKWKEHQDNLKKSTEGLKNVMSSTKGAIKDFGDSMDGAKTKLVSMTEEVRKGTTAQAELAQSLGDMWADINDNNSTLDRYIDTITTLTSKYDENGNKIALTATEQARLEAAVRAYNDATGESIEIVDAANGKLSVSTDELKKNTDALKRQAKMQGAIKALEEEYLALEDRKSELSAAQEYYNSLLEQEAEYRRLGGAAYEGYLQKIRQAADDVAEAQANYDALNGSIKDHEALLWEIGDAAQPFISAMESMGVSVRDFGDISEEQFNALVSSFDGSIDSVISTCQSEGIKIPTALASAMQSTASQPGDVMEGIAGDVVSEAGVLPGEALTIAQNTVSSLAGGLKSGTDQVRTAAGNVGAEANSALSSTNNFHSIGANFTSAFGKGMTSVSIGSAARSVANSAMSAMKDALGIHSPSKEGIWIGEMFEKGVQLGIENSSKSLNAAMYGMGQDSVQAMNRGMYAIPANIPAAQLGLAGVEAAQSSRRNIDINININGNRVESTTNPEATNALMSLINALGVCDDMGVNSYGY